MLKAPGTNRLKLINEKLLLEMFDFEITALRRGACGAGCVSWTRTRTGTSTTAVARRNSVNATGSISGSSSSMSSGSGNSGSNNSIRGGSSGSSSSMQGMHVMTSACPGHIIHHVLNPRLLSQTPSILSTITCQPLPTAESTKSCHPAPNPQKRIIGLWAILDNDIGYLVTLAAEAEAAAGGAIAAAHTAAATATAHRRHRRDARCAPARLRQARCRATRHSPRGTARKLIFVFRTTNSQTQCSVKNTLHAMLACPRHVAQ